MATPLVCSIPGCDKPVKFKGWCSGHHQRWYRYGSPLAGGTSPGSARRFVEEAARSEADDCIVWPYATSPLGYGRVRYDGKTEVASRLVLKLAGNHPPQPDYHAAHDPKRCNNPRCINPRHLRWASPAENIHDQAIAGTKPLGSAKGMSKLTEEQVRAIRRLATVSAHDLAARYGVTYRAITDVRMRRTWAHLD